MKADQLHTFWLHVENFIHTGHQCIEKYIARAKEHVFWPGIIVEIKDIVSYYRPSHDEFNQQPAESIIPHKISEILKIKTDTGMWNLNTPQKNKTMWLLLIIQPNFSAFTPSQSNNLPLLSCILRAYLKNSPFHKLSSVTMVLNSKQMNLKYLLRIGIPNMPYLVLSIRNPKRQTHSEEGNKKQPKPIVAYWQLISKILILKNASSSTPSANEIFHLSRKWLLVSTQHSIAEFFSKWNFLLPTQRLFSRQMNSANCLKNIFSLVGTNCRILLAVKWLVSLFHIIKKKLTVQDRTWAGWLGLQIITS